MSDVHPSFSPETPATISAERRTRVRYTASLEASCRRTGELGGQSWQGRVVNISSGGIGLLVRHCFQANTLLDVEFQGTSGPALLVLRVRVIHCTAYTDEGASSWLLGCAFAKDLADEDLLPLLDAEAPAQG